MQPHQPDAGAANLCGSPWSVCAAADLRISRGDRADIGDLHEEDRQLLEVSGTGRETAVGSEWTLMGRGCPAPSAVG